MFFKVDISLDVSFVLLDTDVKSVSIPNSR